MRCSYVLKFFRTEERFLKALGSLNEKASVVGLKVSLDELNKAYLHHSAMKMRKGRQYEKPARPNPHLFDVRMRPSLAVL
jgi:hypothetical protein